MPSSRVAVLSLLFLSASRGLKIGGNRNDESEATPPRGHVQDVPASSAVRPSAGSDRVSPERAKANEQQQKRLLVVGSLNLDVIVEVDRLPKQGENIVARSPNVATALGGKGANQAIAAARLARGTDLRTDFVCQFGNDAHAERLEHTLAASGVGLDGCGRSSESATGQGLVFLQSDGAVSAVVVGGSNEAGWTEEFAQSLGAMVRESSALLLQREIPEAINELLARQAHAAGVAVIQDVGGADRSMSDDLLSLLAYVCPNETELARLTGMATASRTDVLRAAKSLQARGASNVLVTRGAEGAVLLRADGDVIDQPALSVPGGKVVDTTGAGDAFRAAFAVALTERRPLAESLRFASAAGAIAVTRLGAEPSLPTREECDAVLHGEPLPARAAPTASDAPARKRGKAPPSKHGAFDAEAWEASESHGACPLKFGSRLNSMKDREDLWDGGTDVLGLVARQGTVDGLDLVDFNYPQHLKGVSPDDALAALDRAGLKAGAICMRYEKEHQLGALTHPDEVLRRRAIEMSIEGGRYAEKLGANELVIWSAFDGYDYQHQVNYDELWSRVVDGFREICDALPQVRVSLEFKPTDENTRFFAVPSTGAALLLANEIDRPNFGLTLDIGHMIMAGENPAQSVALVGRAGKLFGVQLNDGHAKLGAEDGLMFGSVHPAMALEFIYWLQKVRFDGHIYFDTFPRNESPVREAEYNIRRVKALWKKAAELRAGGELEALLAKHDAMGVLELLERKAE